MSSGPLVVNSKNGGSIDPSPLLTSGGSAYLLWKSDDNALGARTHLWSQQLSSDGRALVGSRAMLLSQGRPWQSPAIEGPSMVASGGLYYLFYGAIAWDSGNAGVGHARCLSALGPCVNASVNSAWMRRHAVRRLPVVEAGRPVGIVSIGDLVQDRHAVVDSEVREALAISTAPPDDP